MINQNDNIVTLVIDKQISENYLKYLTPEAITEQLLQHIAYNTYINESQNKPLLEYIRNAKIKADETNSSLEIDEGLISGLLGALTGATVGPKIGKAMCEALGVTKGFLYDLLTSKLVTAAICAKMGMRI